MKTLSGRQEKRYFCFLFLLLVYFGCFCIVLFQSSDFDPRTLTYPTINAIQDWIPIEIPIFTNCEHTTQGRHIIADSKGTVDQPKIQIFNFCVIKNIQEIFGK